MLVGIGVVGYFKLPKAEKAESAKTGNRPPGCPRVRPGLRVRAAGNALLNLFGQRHGGYARGSGHQTSKRCVATVRNSLTNLLALGLHYFSNATLTGVSLLFVRTSSYKTSSSIRVI
jgi:hypothetical protein